MPVLTTSGTRAHPPSFRTYQLRTFLYGGRAAKWISRLCSWRGKKRQEGERNRDPAPHNQISGARELFYNDYMETLGCRLFRFGVGQMGSRPLQKPLGVAIA